MNKTALDNLRAYKSAWSYIHNAPVKIINVRRDELGQCIFDCEVEGFMTETPYLFRMSELSNFSE